MSFILVFSFLFGRVCGKEEREEGGVVGALSGSVLKTNYHVFRFIEM